MRTPREVDADLDRILHYGERIETMQTRAIQRLGKEIIDIWHALGVQDRSEALNTFFVSEAQDDAIAHEPTIMGDES